MAETDQTFKVPLDGGQLTLDHIDRLIHGGAQFYLPEDAKDKVVKCHTALLAMIDSDRPMYGVNTGFGIFSDRSVDPSQAEELSQNLILSHASAVGEPYDDEVVLAAMVIRANTLAKGYSGVRPELIDSLIQMINQQVIPLIPQQGSLGSSGDLAPLAHLALVLTDVVSSEGHGHSGTAKYQGQLLTGQEAMQQAGIPRHKLGAKEGLALTNGASFSAALLAIACIAARKSLLSAEAAAALSLEAMLGVSSAFDHRLHSVRPHPGQIEVARRIREHTSESEMLDHSGRLQDAYSLRCAPQVIGPAWDILGFTQECVEREINSATDNPLLFQNDLISGGNFHGEPVGLAADYLKLSLAEVAAISERRIFRLTAGHTNQGLPAMLVADPSQAGIQSGLMILQYTAASLVLENQHLAQPDTIHSIPSSGDQEDHNSNSTTAARNLRGLIENINKVIAIELICAAQALDLRREAHPGLAPGTGTSSIYTRIRAEVPFANTDRPFSEKIERIAGLVQAGEFAME